jgi:hypothetical protein
MPLSLAVLPAAQPLRAKFFWGSCAVVPVRFGVPGSMLVAEAT